MQKTLYIEVFFSSGVSPSLYLEIQVYDKQPFQRWLARQHREHVGQERVYLRGGENDDNDKRDPLKKTLSKVYGKVCSKSMW